MKIAAPRFPALIASLSKFVVASRYMPYRLTQSGHWIPFCERQESPRPVNSPSGKCCAVDEWPISALRGGAESYATAAFLVLRAHAAKKSNSQFGLSVAIGSGAASPRSGARGKTRTALSGPPTGGPDAAVATRIAAIRCDREIVARSISHCAGLCGPLLLNRDGPLPTDHWVKDSLALTDCSLGKGVASETDVFSGSHERVAKFDLK